MSPRTLALLTALGFAASSGVALAGGGDCGSYHVDATKQTVASSGQSSTPVVVPTRKDG